MPAINLVVHHLNEYGFNFFDTRISLEGTRIFEKFCDIAYRSAGDIQNDVQRDESLRGPTPFFLTNSGHNYILYV